MLRVADGDCFAKALVRKVRIHRAVGEPAAPAQTKRLLRNPDKIETIVAGDGTRLELSRFDLDNIDDNDIFTVGADSKFDVVNFNERQIEAIKETFDGVT